MLVPEPMTLEPCESYSRADLDEYATVLTHISDEAHSDPELVRSAPHASTIHRIQEDVIDDPSRLAMTWRGFLKKQEQAADASVS